MDVRACQYSFSKKIPYPLLLNRGARSARMEAVGKKEKKGTMGNSPFRSQIDNRKTTEYYRCSRKAIVDRLIEIGRL